MKSQTSRKPRLRPTMPIANAWLLSIATALGWLPLSLAAQVTALHLQRAQFHAPPTPPPVEIVEQPSAESGKSLSSAGQTLYSIGQPTDEEQLYLELINRARVNPPEEGVRLANLKDPDVLGAYEFFAVDTNLLVSQFDAISSNGPLAMNEQLTTAARLHAMYLFNNVTQSHTGSGGSTLGDRVRAQGYRYSVGENVYSYAKSVVHGHAGFEVDWGVGPGGMQTPPGHRINTHNGLFHEVGIGMFLGTNRRTNELNQVEEVGPQLVVQDFGAGPAGKPFVTGVAYYDLNGNGVYDLGEGIGGVTVRVSGSTFYAITANSGGYAVPVSGNGDFNVTFSGPGFTDATLMKTISENNNAKADFIPAYAPPVVSGADMPGVDRANVYSFTPVGGATDYEWKQARVIPVSGTEGAEDGLNAITTDTSDGYEVIVSNPKKAGSHSFHLAHVAPADQFSSPPAQSLALDRVFLPSVSSQLKFYSRLGTASSNQVAMVEISTDEGRDWQEVWSERGTGSGGENSFNLQTISLAPFADELIQVRFRFLYLGGLYYSASNPGLVGWYFDEIQFTQTEELVDAVVMEATGAHELSFQPGQAGDYLLAVRPRISGRGLPFGPETRVSAVNAPAEIRFGAIRVAGQNIELDFEAVGESGGGLQLQRAAHADGPWAVDSAATIQTIDASHYRATTGMGNANQQYFRVEMP